MNNRTMGTGAAGLCVAALLLWLLWPDAEAPEAVHVPEQTGSAPAPVAIAPSPASLPSASPPPLEVVEPGSEREKELIMMVEAYEMMGMRVACKVEPPVPEARGHVEVGVPGTSAHAHGSEASVFLGVLYIPGWTMDEGERGGVLNLQGWQPVDISWGPSTDKGPAKCASEPISLKPATTHIVGAVTGAPADLCSTVFITGCGAWARPNDDCTFDVTVREGACFLRAGRSLKRGRLIGQKVSVTPVSGQTVSTTLALPEGMRGSLGFGNGVAVDGGMRLARPIDGGAAEDAGIRRGDVLVELGGIDASTFSNYDLWELDMGEPGSAIVVVVDGKDGERREIQLTREAAD